MIKTINTIINLSNNYAMFPADTIKKLTQLTSNHILHIEYMLNDAKNESVINYETATILFNTPAYKSWVKFGNYKDTSSNIKNIINNK